MGGAVIDCSAIGWPACRCGDSKSGGGLPGVERSLTSLEAELEEGAAAELPLSMSTDEEGER